MTRVQRDTGPKVPPSVPRAPMLWKSDVALDDVDLTAQMSFNAADLEREHRRTLLRRAVSSVLVVPRAVVVGRG